MHRQCHFWGAFRQVYTPWFRNLCWPIWNSSFQLIFWTFLVSSIWHHFPSISSQTLAQPRSQEEVEVKYQSKSVDSGTGLKPRWFSCSVPISRKASHWGQRQLLVLAKDSWSAVVLERLYRLGWRRAWQPTPVFLPKEFHVQRILAGYSLWCHKASDTTEATEHAHTHA